MENKWKMPEGTHSKGKWDLRLLFHITVHMILAINLYLYRGYLMKDKGRTTTLNFFFWKSISSLMCDYVLWVIYLVTENYHIKRKKRLVDVFSVSSPIDNSDCKYNCLKKK